MTTPCRPLWLMLPEGSPGSPGVSFGCACRMLSREQPLPQGSDVGSKYRGEPAAFEVGRFPKDCLAVWLLFAGNTLWVCIWGGKWDVVCLLRVLFSLDQR